MSSFLAVHRASGEMWIEDNRSAIDTAVVLEKPVRFYQIVLNEDNQPRLGPEVRRPLSPPADEEES